MIADLRVDMERLWATLMASARIGATERGGLRRLALSPQDGEMRALFARWCEETGLTLRVDAMGNMFALRPGRRPGAKAIMIGSHLDTQIFGGRFDGVLGVLAGLEILRTLDDRGVETQHPLIVANWTNEEGARFEPAMIGSKVFAGLHPLEAALDIRDKAGVRLGDALRAIGFAGDAALGPEDIDSYFELHIEQGPQLDALGAKIGVVVGAYDIRYLVVEATGESAHSGATPLADRRNAMVAAAHVVVAVDEIGAAHAATGARSACGRLVVEPNLLGAVAHRAEILCDFRHADPTVAQAMVDAFRARLPAIADASRCALAATREWRYGGAPYDAALAGLLRDAARALGHAPRDMLTVAGHDSMNLACVVPSVMIFTPCDRGVSHNEAENVSRADVEPAVNAMLGAVLGRDAGLRSEPGAH
ncbi:MAG: Zn-dependent hydrolase [Rhodoblastus sp.]|nr:MAG: Zn-dependent hydrolase [Rhodoblastus sp.]